MRQVPGKCLATSCPMIHEHAHFSNEDTEAWKSHRSRPPPQSVPPPICTPTCSPAKSLRNYSPGEGGWGLGPIGCSAPLRMDPAAPGSPATSPRAWLLGDLLASPGPGKVCFLGKKGLCPLTSVMPLSSGLCSLRLFPQALLKGSLDFAVYALRVPALLTAHTY